MRTPSIKRLVATFDLTREQASLIKRLGVACDSAEALSTLIEAECPATDRYARSCFHNPYTSQMWRRTMALHAIDCILGTHGVESLGEGKHSEGYASPYEYCNAGDPYAATLIYRRATDNLYVGCWATLVENRKVAS